MDINVYPDIFHKTPASLDRHLSQLRGTSWKLPQSVVIAGFLNWVTISRSTLKQLLSSSFCCTGWSCKTLITDKNLLYHHGGCKHPSCIQTYIDVSTKISYWSKKDFFYNIYSLIGFVSASLHPIYLPISDKFHQTAKPIYFPIPTILFSFVISQFDCCLYWAREAFNHGFIIFTLLWFCSKVPIWGGIFEIYNLFVLSLRSFQSCFRYFHQRPFIPDTCRRQQFCCILPIFYIFST